MLPRVWSSIIRKYTARCDQRLCRLGLVWWRCKSKTTAPWVYAACSTQKHFSICVPALINMAITLTMTATKLSWCYHSAARISASPSNLRERPVLCLQCSDARCVSMCVSFFFCKIKVNLQRGGGNSAGELKLSEAADNLVFLAKDDVFKIPEDFWKAHHN